MLTRALRGLQAFLALQLACTLVVAHDQVVSAVRFPRTPSLLDSLSPYSLDREHLDVGLPAIVVLLLLAALGLMPRVLVPLQFWLTAWFPVTCVTLSDGGDIIAGLLVFELLPYFVDPRPQTLRLSRFAVRTQMTLVYLSAGISKLEVPAWRHGTALRSYGSDPLDGLLYGSWLRVLEQPFVLHLLTWSTPVVEIAIAASIFGGPRYRRAALVAGVALHLAIGIGFGLYTFQLVMIAGLIVLTEPWRGLVRAPSVGADEAPGAVPQDIEH